MVEAVMEPEVKKEARGLPAPRRILLENETIAAGDERRLLPNLNVSRWDRLHFHFSNGTSSRPGRPAWPRGRLLDIGRSEAATSPPPRGRFARGRESVPFCARTRP